jgi:VanZ like family
MLGRGYGKRAFIVAWLINHFTGIARMLAWMGILIIIILSVVPAADRPVTGAGQLLEHLTAFAIVGGAFAIGYRFSLKRLMFLAVLFCAGIELLQIPLPTRHARVSDFLVDTAGACLAILCVFVARQILSTTIPGAALLGPMSYVLLTGAVRFASGGHRVAAGRWGIAMSIESLTYAELGDRLGASPEAARSLARRMRLPRKPGNDGRVRVIVDLSEIQYRPLSARPPGSQQTDIDSLSAQIKQLQAELAKLEMEKQCLEDRAAGHRADFERERDRCDTLTAETLNWTKVAMTARERAARLEGEISARRGRRWWGRLVAARGAGATRPPTEKLVTAASPSPSQLKDGQQLLPVPTAG